MDKLFDKYIIVYRNTQIDENNNIYIDIIFITKDGMNFYETQLPSIAHQNVIYSKMFFPKGLRYDLTGVLQRNEDYQGWIEEYGKEIMSEFSYCICNPQHNSFKGQTIDYINDYLHHIETMFDKLMMIGYFKLNSDLIRMIRMRFINVTINYPHFKQYFQYQEN